MASEHEEGGAVDTVEGQPEDEVCILADKKQNRDPNNLNEQINLNFNNLIGEPSNLPTGTIDCAWNASEKCFHGCQRVAGMCSSQPYLEFHQLCVGVYISLALPLSAYGILHLSFDHWYVQHFLEYISEGTLKVLCESCAACFGIAGKVPGMGGITQNLNTRASKI